MSDDAATVPGMDLTGVNDRQTYRATVIVLDPDGPGTIEYPNRLVRFHLPGFVVMRFVNPDDSEDEEIEAIPLARIVTVTKIEKREQKATASAPARNLRLPPGATNTV